MINKLICYLGNRMKIQKLLRLCDKVQMFNWEINLGGCEIFNSFFSLSPLINCPTNSNRGHIKGNKRILHCVPGL